MNRYYTEIDKKFVATFCGKRGPRDKFVAEALQEIHAFVGNDLPHPAPIFYFFGEIIKNIYDHADGCGKMILEKDKKNKLLLFDVKNEKSDSLLFKTEMQKEVRQKTDYKSPQFGFQSLFLGFDGETMKKLGLQMTLTPTKGFHYAGKLKTL